METRLVKGKGKQVWDKCGFSDGWVVPRVRFGGRLILAWMLRESLAVDFASENLIHISLLDNKGNPLSITFVYGHPNHAKRDLVWQQLKSLKDHSHPNWLCIGDFNQVLNSQDKLSFKQGSIVGANLLQQVIDDLHLCDLTTTGQRYTWLNNREDEDLVMERLDRAFATVDWVNMYPLHSLRNLPIIHSDHGPILLDLEVRGPYRIRPFRFEHMWISHSTCHDLIKQSWNLNLSGSRAAQLRNKLSNVRKNILEWNRRVFGRVETEIQEKKTQLQILQNSISSIEDAKAEKALRMEIETLLDREELMILHIKNGQGFFTDKLEEIETILNDHFKENYENRNNISVEELVNELQGLPIPTLSIQDCTYLIRPVSKQEALARKLKVNLVHNPSKYLGLNFKLKGNRIADFHFLVEKLQSKLQGWKARLLSQARRTTLISSVLQSLPLYTFSCFKVLD
nr:hypothetical protein CFP56_60122 [Quercus suber]